MRRTLLAVLLATASCAAPAPGPSRLKIGLCAGLGDLARAKEVGFDYVELPVRDIAKLSDAEFAAAVEAHAKIGLPTPVANNFLPADLKITGPAVDHPRQEAYLELALARMKKLGVSIVVLGSGDARRVPEGFSTPAAFDQLVDFARRAAPIAAKNGIRIAVEPLRQQETNIIHTAAQGLEWVRAVKHPNFRLMVDFYHLASENEDPDILRTAREHILHFHMANPKGRVYPLDAAEYDYARFFARVREIGIQGGMSVEAKPVTSLEADGPRSIAFLRSVLR